MKKYGLQLRVPPSLQKKPLGRPPLPPPLGFHDDDEDDVEQEISRHAGKNRALKEIEEQHKRALEDDPNVFDYDGVYDEMKEKFARPVAQEREERKPRYIQALIDKAKEREREHEIIYERKIAKERSKDDHLYADKDKFVTSAYKKKLAEQAKWMEDERLRQLREEEEDVTKKKDLTDFYFNLSKNVAFGSEDAKKKGEDQKKKLLMAKEEKARLSDAPSEAAKVSLRHQGEASISGLPEEQLEAPRKPNVIHDTPTQITKEKPSTEQPKQDHHKRNEDAVAAAKERFLARKRAKQQ